MAVDHNRSQQERLISDLLSVKVINPVTSVKGALDAGRYDIFSEEIWLLLRGAEESLYAIRHMFKIGG